MKKVMSILTVAAFFVGASGIVSFTVAEKSSSTAWFYADPDTGEPNLSAPGDHNNPDCEQTGPPCLIEVDLDNNMEPTGQTIDGVRPQN